jgi:acyl carrier protein
MSSLKSIVSKVLGIDESMINDDLSPENTDSWDSFNSLMLVSELESNFSLSFSMDEVKAVKCYKDIKEALKRHGVRIEDEI